MKETKSAYIIVRVTPTEKKNLKKEGGKKFSQFIRSKLGLNENNS